MPKVRWNIDSKVIDKWDRSSQYKPYDGPVPPNGVYKWKLNSFKYVPATKDKYEQLRIGVTLIPRDSRKGESRYKGYSLLLFRPITENNAFTYAPLLDAFGVSGKDLTQRTITDSEGNITSIGKWRNTGDVEIMGELKEKQDDQGVTRKDLGWIGPVEEEDEYGDDELDEELEDEDEEDYDEDDDEDYEDEEDDDEAF